MHASTLTDDLGEYRLGGLPDGRYVVMARVARTPMMAMVASGGTTITSGMDMALSRAYYPGVPSLAEAQRIDLRPGEERSPIDFGVAARHALAKLTLSFVDSNGNATSATATLSSGDEYAGGVTIGIPSIGPSLATRVEPGTWAIYATGTAGAAIATVTIGSDDVAINIPLIKGGSVSGRVIPESGRLPRGAIVEIEAHPSTVSMEALLGRGSLARMTSDGSFQLTDLLGVRELRVRSAPPGWLAKAILYDGRDLLDSGIEFKGGESLAGVQVILTDRHAELSGTVIAGERAPVAQYSVIVFPEDERLLHDPRRLARLARPNQEGRFRVDDLLPGSYLVAATADVDVSQWLNADYLARFRPVATRISLTELEKKNIILPLVEVR